MGYHTFEDIRDIGLAFDYRVTLAKLTGRTRRLTIQMPALLEKRTVRYFNVARFMKPKLSYKPALAVDLFNRVTYAGFIDPSSGNLTDSKLKSMFLLEAGDLRYLNFQNRDLSDPYNLLILTLFWLQNSLQEELQIDDNSAYYGEPYNIGVKDGVLLGKYNKGLHIGGVRNFKDEFYLPQGTLDTKNRLIQYFTNYAKTITNTETRREIHLLSTLLISTCEPRVVERIETAGFIRESDPRRGAANGEVRPISNRLFRDLTNLLELAEHPTVKLFQALVPGHMSEVRFRNLFTNNYRNLSNPRPSTRDRYKKSLDMLRKEA